MARRAPRRETADAFLRRAKQRNPAKYAKVCEAYPVLTRWKWRQIATHEILAGDVRQLGQQ